MPPAPTRRWRASVTLLASAGALVLGVLAVAVGWSPALLTAVAGALLTVAFAQRFSWALAVAAAVLGLLGLHTLVSRLAPIVGVDFGLATTGAACLAGGAAAVALAVFAGRGGRDRAGLRLPGRADASALAGAAGVPAVTLGFWVVALRWGPDMQVGWLLANDAVWNTMAARFVIADGGVVPAVHPNPAPSSAALAASWMIPGRDTAEEMLRHDVVREAQLVLLLTVAAAVLAGLIAARAVTHGHPVLRIVAGSGASALLLSWYLLGFTAELGFVNAPIAVLVLLAAWLCWSEVERAPMLAGAGLFLAATLTLATWAPLVLVPVALGIGGVFVAGRLLFARRRASWIVLAFAALQLVVYVAFITLADLRSTGGALAADGAAPPVEPRDVAAVVGLALAIVLLTLLRVRDAGLRNQAIGVVVVLASAAFGGGYLVLQRLGQELGWWGYYPAKFAWLICVLLLVVITGVLVALTARLASGRARALAAPAALVVVALVAAGSLPLGGVFRLPAAVALATDDRFTASGAMAERLFALADAGPTISVRGPDGVVGDALVNSWLLQAHSERSEDPVRQYAYGLDTYDATSICGAVAASGGPVVVATTDPGLEAELAATCPEADYDVDVSP